MINAVSEVVVPLKVLVAESAFQPEEELPPPPVKLNGPTRMPAETLHFCMNEVKLDSLTRIENDGL